MSYQEMICSFIRVPLQRLRACVLLIRFSLPQNEISRSPTTTCTRACTRSAQRLVPRVQRCLTTLWASTEPQRAEPPPAFLLLTPPLQHIVPRELLKTFPSCWCPYHQLGANTSLRGEHKLAIRSPLVPCFTCWGPSGWAWFHWLWSLWCISHNRPN